MKIEKKIKQKINKKLIFFSISIGLYTTQFHFFLLN